jgi:hypothetical protein
MHATGRLISGTTTGILCLLVALTAAGCPQAQPNSTSNTAQQPSAQAGTAATGNLFTGTPLADYPPDALDINRDGTRLFAKQFVPDGANTLVVSIPLTDAGLGEPGIIAESSDVMHSFVRAHPTENGCLLISNEQAAGGPVVDVIWQYYGEQRSPLPYADAEGFPQQLPPQARYDLEPLYSWDGTWIIVPLHSAGLCIMDSASNRGRFISYPQLPGEPTGQSFGALPPKDGRNLIYVSQWHKIKGPDEWCEVRLLDLDNGEWLLPVGLDWLAYEVAAADAINQPWLVRGSRAPNKASEHRYLPRLALLDPRSQVVELQLFHGTPYWPVKLDPLGRYVVYLDQQLQAIARLEQATGRLDLDKRFYQDDAQLFVAPGADPVYVWYRDTLLRAEYTEHEDFGE